MSKLNIPIHSSRRNSDTSHIFPAAVTALRVFHDDNAAGDEDTRARTAGTVERQPGIHGISEAGRPAADPLP
ncbi:hypothetical protein IRT45_30695 [Nocardia sp. BSTN01]|uniref:hypothetical protein n=1 Tax=Nocardia sp. BSTN01 TaxID=2783665 RepID=UPI00188DFF36|nr:hypothetical protein [Nocardia sp. BSTN01]MBF5001506.1 hypothetical protein [Nocardia sp. BSTN01]